MAPNGEELERGRPRPRDRSQSLQHFPKMRGCRCLAGVGGELFAFGKNAPSLLRATQLSINLAEKQRTLRIVWLQFMKRVQRREGILHVEVTVALRENSPYERIAFRRMKIRSKK